MKKSNAKHKKRDFNIKLNSTMEISLNTKSISSKKIYNRKKNNKRIVDYE